MSLSHTELRFPREVPKSESLSAVSGRWLSGGPLIPQPQLVTGLFLRARAVLGTVQSTGAGMAPPSASPQFSKGDETVIKVENDHCPKRGAY